MEAEVQPEPGVPETVIVSDMHLADAEPVAKGRPYWRAYKQARFFIDDDFARLLAHADAEAEGPIELILNGDIFDFDSITRLPEHFEGPASWIVRLRGLPSEEWMSLFKIDLIIEEHPVWFEAMRGFIEKGHRAVFVIGNHDAELHWPSVQERLRDALHDDGDEHRVTFATAFYISGGDTYVSHGHLYDPLCSEKSPIDPLILVHGRPRIRLPFGDMAMRYMLNGMGYFNPHATANYVMSARDYARFFFRFMARTQPFLIWTWFWSALTTLILSLRDFWQPEMRDPMLVEEKTESVARRSNTTAAVVRRVMALTVPSACTDPVQVARVLWLDRGLFFLGILYLAWQVLLTVNFVWPISPWWGFLFLLLLFPPFLLYSFRVSPPDTEDTLLTEQRALMLHNITGTKNVVFGHTHGPLARTVGPMTYVNGGFWSPAFKEPSCETRLGTQTFVRLRPRPGGRRPELLEWPPGGEAPRPYPAPVTTPASELATTT
ncbi:MAG: metallophosphoesterase [Myxococcales bacterium]|nr:metallophosphoesterase [Myxococcales bacterium]